MEFGHWRKSNLYCSKRIVWPVTEFNSQLTQWLQVLIVPLEWLMLLLILGGGLYLIQQSKGRPFFFIPKAFRLLFQKEGEQGISRFQALSAVLAATVGLGNISGVAIAIHMGGPGILVWMWLTALVGMIIKFYSCSLSVALRHFDAAGQPLGGPMYYMSLGLKKWGKPLAIWFSLAGLVGVLPAFTANQLTQSITTVLPLESFFHATNFQIHLVLGICFALLTAWVIFGGLQSIVRVTSNLVPVMVIIYLLMGGFVLLTQFDQVGPALTLIFNEAFNFQTAAAGGFWGLVLLGVRRAVFSNESGVGNAPMYHGQSQSKKPTDEGLVALLGPLLDTLGVCTITGLIVIISKAYLLDLNGILLTLEAFNRLFFGWGDVLLLFMVLVFGVSTLFTYAYYGTKCFGYLTRPNWGKLYNLFYVGSIVFAAITTTEVVVGLIDIAFALMCIPNMVAVLLLAPTITKKMQAELSP